MISFANMIRAKVKIFKYVKTKHCQKRRMEKGKGNIKWKIKKIFGLDDITKFRNIKCAVLRMQFL